MFELYKSRGYLDVEIKPPVVDVRQPGKKVDEAKEGYLADVFILESHRGRGLARWLMETILAHPELQGIRRWNLVTRDAHELYRRVGFQDVAKPVFLNSPEGETFTADNGPTMTAMRKAVIASLNIEKKKRDSIFDIFD